MFAPCMSLRNRIKEFVNELGITRYQFCKDTGLAENTGYRLYKDSTYIPGSEAMAKICDTYKVQPNELIYWVEGSNASNSAIFRQRMSDPYQPSLSFEEERRLIGDDNPTNPYTPPGSITPRGGKR